MILALNLKGALILEIIKKQKIKYPKKKKVQKNPNNRDLVKVTDLPSTFY